MTCPVGSNDDAEMKLFAITLDTPDPVALAQFYRGLLGGEIVSTNDTYVALSMPDVDLRLDFQ